MKILIIGGSGFVSGTLAEVAVTAGHQVWAVTRGQKSLPSGVTAIVADRTERTEFASAIEQTGEHWDLVVDCIGFQPEDAQQDIVVFRDKAQHVVFISTDFVFDPQYRNFPQGETSDHFLSDGYGGNKRCCELEFLEANSAEIAWTIIRPCHIYGPGSLLGCLPLHGRDPQLVPSLQKGQALKLVGGGHFLQQPIFARDLAQLILSCAGKTQTYGQIYNAAGPDIIESRQYYGIIADILGVSLQVEEIPVAPYLAENPDKISFLCHRIYDLHKLREHNLAVPSTPIRVGLHEHVIDVLRHIEADN
jgi:nucleoside-diphosphate-sugar epimerase